MRILIKGEMDYEEYDMGSEDLLYWFKNHTDKEGNVQEDIVVFSPAIFKADENGSRWTLSDYSVDRDLERIDPTGWNLKTFKNNPVVLWAHDHMRPAIGKATNLKVRDGKLSGSIQFSEKEIDEFGWMIGQKVKEGIISAGSVGFKSNKIEVVDDKKEEARLIHRKTELYEFSIVNIPSNVNATVERSYGLESGGTVTVTAEGYKYNCSEDADHERIEAEIAGLHVRIADLENEAYKSKNYIGSIMDIDRETIGQKSGDTSKMDKLFEKPKSNWEDYFGKSND